jgi:hypothetical protein
MTQLNNNNQAIIQHIRYLIKKAENSQWELIQSSESFYEALLLSSMWAMRNFSDDPEEFKNITQDILSLAFQNGITNFNLGHIVAFVICYCKYPEREKRHSVVDTDLAEMIDTLEIGYSDFFEDPECSKTLISKIQFNMKHYALYGGGAVPPKHCRQMFYNLFEIYVEIMRNSMAFQSVLDDQPFYYGLSMTRHLIRCFMIKKLPHNALCSDIVALIDTKLLRECGCPAYGTLSARIKEDSRQDLEYAKAHLAQFRSKPVSKEDLCTALTLAHDIDVEYLFPLEIVDALLLPTGI